MCFVFFYLLFNVLFLSMEQFLNHAAMQRGKTLYSCFTFFILYRRKINQSKSTRDLSRYKLHRIYTKKKKKRIDRT